MVLHNPKNWHWVDKNVLSWTKEWIEEQATKASAEDGEVKAKINKLTKIGGFAEVSQRKNKVISLFEVDIALEFSGSAPDADDVSGTITVPEIAHDTDEYVFEIAIDAESKEKEPVKALVKSKIVPQLREIFPKLLPALIEEHGKDIQHAAGVDPSSGFSTPTYQEQSKPSTPQPTKTATQSSSGTSRVVNTETLVHESDFKTVPAELYKRFTNEEFLKEWTNPTDKKRPDLPLFEGAHEGGNFKLFGGSIEGKFLELDEPNKIVQLIRLKGWPADYYSKQVLEFKVSKDTQAATTLHLTWSGIPTGQLEAMRNQWQQMYEAPIMMIYGWRTTISASPY